MQACRLGANPAGASPGSVSSSFGTSLLDNAPRDFTLNNSSKELVIEPMAADDAKSMLHVTSPGMYMNSLQAAGLELIDFRNLSEHLALFYDGMIDEVRLWQPGDCQLCVFVMI